MSARPPTLASPVVPTSGGRARGCRVALALGLLAVGAAGGAACGGQDPPTAVVPQEQSRLVAGLPPGWVNVGTGGAYASGVDSGVTRAGAARSVSVRSAGAVSANGFGGFVQSVRADDYRGRRVRLRGWVRTRGATGDGAGLWLRVDGQGAGQVLDNSAGRRVAGSGDWREVTVVVDVPADADGLAFGGLLVGEGQAWFDGFAFDVVGPEVAATVPTPASLPSNPANAAAMRAAYERLPRAPQNLAFADAPPPDAAAVAWLRGAAVPFDRADPGGAADDLAPLRAMVGSARLVGLGEGTHGTREHFLMKHRVFESLVRELGFTAFAIEATMPEAGAIDRYVRTGEGDPAVLLSNLYFWTWNTAEVLDLIRWMRAYNESASPARQLRFFGVDMQYPGAAIDSAAAFARRVDPAAAGAVDSAYQCLAPYRNQGARTPSARYATLAAAERQACAARVTGVHAAFAAAEARYRAAASDEEYARALQHARLVVQWEDMAGRSSAADGSLARDRHMAENTAWALAQLPAGTRMALWAHNYHVSATPGAQGAHLRARFGADYLTVGFAFGTGTFSAIASANGAFGALGTQSTTYVAPGSVEAYARAVGLPRFVVDMRRAADEPAAAPLRGPLPMRSVGSVFDAARPELHVVSARLPEDFDVLVYFAEGTATRLLPFRFE